MPADAPSPSPALAAALTQADEQRAAARERLFAFLCIPSVSAQPAHAPDCERAAGWMRDELIALGFTAEVRPTAGLPVTLAHYPGPPGYAGPHILFYGHYDVQPPEPLALWNNPPFQPQIVQGPNGDRVVARGAVDDKGQVMTFIEALRAWKATGGVPARITVLIEGEEEIGSKNLEPFLIGAKDDLHADLALISDTGMWDIDTPAITTRLRGMVYIQVTLKGPSRDLHSGGFGGSALNPINALTRILGELHDPEGRVAIPGFYDEVKELSADEAAQWDALGFDEAAFLADIGLTTPVGERDRPGLQRLWSRPTADINGIWGGYTGVGAKTVIASEASAKLSFRLVPDQDPAHVLEAAKRFFAERLPPGARLEFQTFSSARAIAVDFDQPWIAAAREVLSEEYGRPALLMGCGGSIPVVESFRRTLGIDTLLMGFGLADDQMHSPNEKFDLRCFDHGVRSHVRLLARLAGIG